MNKNETVSCVNYNSQPEWMPWSGNKVCPNCGSHEIEYNTRIVLTSYPAQSQLRCRTCSHIFSSGMNIEWTCNDALNDKWKHDQSILNIPKVGDWPPAPQPGDWPSSPTITDPLPATNKTTMYGWICPKCGAVLAPHVSSCPHCSPATTVNITY